MLPGRAVGPTGHILTVEPDPAAAALLHHNLERNRCANITRIREATGAARAVARRCAKFRVDTATLRAGLPFEVAFFARSVRGIP